MLYMQITKSSALKTSYVAKTKLCFVNFNVYVNYVRVTINAVKDFLNHSPKKTTDKIRQPLKCFFTELFSY